jgi:hypothetical protein
MDIYIYKTGGQNLFRTTIVITFFSDGNFTGGFAVNAELNDIRIIKEWMFKIS